MSSTLDRPLSHRARQPARLGSLVLGLFAAAVGSLLLNAMIALAMTSTHPRGVQTGLQAVHYAPLTVLGVLAGTAGWAVIRRRAAQPRAVLRVVVPAVVVMSFVPDLLLLLNATTVGNVVALLCMHVAIAAITVPVLARVLPLTGPR